MGVRHLSRGLLVAGLILSSSVFAQSASYDVAFDTDRDSATGCTLTPSGGAPIDGIESRLRATVDTTTLTITDVAVLRCNGSGFVTDSSLPAGYPVALNQGAAGADVIELAVDQNGLLGSVISPIQLYFVATDGAGSDVLATTNGQAGGGPIIIAPPFAVPGLTLLGLLVLALVLVAAAWLANRRAGHVAAISVVMLVALAAWASQHAADGNLGEWTGVGPLAQDPGADATNGSAAIDLLAAFAVFAHDQLNFRVDVTDLENQPPQAGDDDYTTDEDNALSVAAPGVLANDSDPEGDPVTAVLDGAPSNAASFTLNPDGSFDYVPAADFNGSDSFTYTANDGQADSAPATVTLTVNPINDPPVAQDDTAVTNEDQQIDIDVLANDSDVDGNLDPASVSVTAGPASGTTSVDPSTGVITYTKSADFSGSDSFDYEVCDDGTPTPVECANATVNLTIDAVNDPPTFTAGSDVTVNEDSGAYSATWATAIDAGAPDESGQVLSFDVTVETNPGLFASSPTIDGSGNLTFTPAADASGSADVTVVLSDDGGTTNGGSDTSAPAGFTISVDPVNDAPTFTSGGDVAVNEDSGAYSAAWATGIDAGAPDESGQTLSFSVTGNDNAALFTAQPAIDAGGNLSFTPAADAFGVANITVELSDDGGTANGGADTSAPVSFMITVNGVNDAPSFVSGGDVTVDEDSGAYNMAWASGISAGPANESGQVLSFNITANDNAALFSTQPAVDPAGNLSFEPAADANGSAGITVELTDDGGTANGGVDTTTPVSFTITVNPVNDPPMVTAPGPFDVTGNVRVQVPDGSDDLLTGVSDPADGANAQPFSITTGSSNSAMGGNVTVNADGTFSYDPPAGYTGADSFDYEVCDSGEPGSACTTASVILNVSDMVWFVDVTAPAGGDGRLASPFDDIDAFNSINDGTGNNPAAGDDLFLFNGTHAGSVALLDNQRVFGQSATLPLATLTGITLPTYSDPFPATNTGTTTLQALNATAVTLATGNTLRGFDIGNTGTGTGVAGNGFGTATILEMAIGGTGRALSLTTGTAAVTLDSIQSLNSGAEGLLLSGVAGSFAVSGNTAIDSAAGIGINIQNVSASYSFGNVTVDNRNSAGVFVNGTTGGAQNGLFGTVTINNQNVSNTTALGIDNTTGGNITTGAVVINGGGAAGSGIALSGNAATINIPSGSVTNAGGAAVSISNGTGNITYGGSISNTANRSLQILNNTGGLIRVTGSTTDTGSGVFVDNNSGAAVELPGTLDLTTGANPAFTASNGGTVTASNASNTVTSTTGTGVSVTNATIGAAGIAFRSVNVNGAANGIRLVNTGNIGDFLVTGDGTLTRNGSGGTIQNTTDDGVYLEGANNVVFQQMNIFDVGNTANPGDITNQTNDHAVETRGGGNITLSAVHIRDPIGTGWEAFDIGGDNSIDNDSLVEELDRTSNFAGLRVTNNNVNFGFVNIADATFDHADPTPGDPANNGNAMVVVSMRGTAGGTFNVDDSTFTGARATAITVNSGDTTGSSGVLNSNIRNSTFEVAHPINGQNNIGMQAIQGTTHNKLADGNTLRDVGRGGSLSGQIIMQKSHTAVMDARADNNVVSEVVDQHGLDVLSLSTSTGGRVDWEANDNTIFDVGRRGVFSSTRGNEPDMDIALRNNTVGRDTGGAVDPVGTGTLAQRGMEIDVQTASNLQASVTNNEVISVTDGNAIGGLATTVMFVNVEEFPNGTATAQVSFDGNTFTNQNNTGSPNMIARTRDSGLTLNLDFNATEANGMSSFVNVEEFSGSTVTIEDLATLNADNPGVSTFNIGAGVTDHGGNVPEPDF